MIYNQTIGKRHLWRYWHNDRVLVAPRYIYRWGKYVQHCKIYIWTLLFTQENGSDAWSILYMKLWEFQLCVKIYIVTHLCHNVNGYAWMITACINIWCYYSCIHKVTQKYNEVYQRSVVVIKTRNSISTFDCMVPHLDRMYVLLKNETTDMRALIMKPWTLYGNKDWFRFLWPW